MKKDLNNPWFEFDTTSKYKNQRAGDCVVRSISLALELPWEQVFDDLCKIARKMYRMPNDKAVYGKYLEQRGWKKMPAPRKEDNHRYLALEFCKKLVPEHNRAIAHVGGYHLSCFIAGKIHDIWDCGNYSVGNYWIEMPESLD